ncbi:IS4 family transposase, partial [Escherichia coli]|nr:IS4 family transposase [Escherichia coli]
RHPGQPKPPDPSSPNSARLTPRRAIRQAAPLPRLGLAYCPCRTLIRIFSSWPQLEDFATLSDVPLFTPLRNAPHCLAILAAHTFAVSAAVTGCSSSMRLRLVEGTAISAHGGGSAEWRLHMGYDPHT